MSTMTAPSTGTATTTTPTTYGERLIGGEARLAVSPICLGILPFGTTVDEETSFAILDRFVEAGGTFLDTSNNYAFWVGTGDESETVLGRWLAERGTRDDVVIATKVGARPRNQGAGLEDAEGLSAAAIRAGLAGSLRRLGTDHVDLYYAHIEDRSVPLAETMGTFGALTREGLVRAVGVSNHTAWRVERASAIARADGWDGYTAIQLRYSYVQPRSGPSLEAGGHVHASPEMVDYVASQPDVTLLAYSSLLSGAYTRRDKTLPPAYDHPGVGARLAALRSVSDDLGATPNQVVLSWLMGGAPAILPIVGVSSVAQLDEVMAARDIVLDAEARSRLDTVV